MQGPITMKQDMALHTVLGNDFVRSTLIYALQNDSLPHAVLLTAPDGCGRNYWARCLAADYLFPDNPTAAKAVLCGESSEVICVRGEGSSGQIKVERIRNMRLNIHQTGLSAKGRVVLVRDAQCMMPPAANALLKVLEEPPAGVLFILTARDATALLPTIQSRCAKYSLVEISLPDTEKFLLQHGATAELASLLAGVYGGKPGLCLQLLQNEERMQILRHAQATCKAAANNDLYTLLCLFSSLEGRKDEDKAHRFLFLSDFSQLLNASMHNTITPLHGGISLRQATCFLPLVQQSLFDLQANMAPKLVFSSLAIHLTEEIL